MNGRSLTISDALREDARRMDEQAKELWELSKLDRIFKKPGTAREKESRYKRLLQRGRLVMWVAYWLDVMSGSALRKALRDYAEAAKPTEGFL